MSLKMAETTFRALPFCASPFISKGFDVAQLRVHLDGGKAAEVERVLAARAGAGLYGHGHCSQLPGLEQGVLQLHRASVLGLISCGCGRTCLMPWLIRALAYIVR